MKFAVEKDQKELEKGQRSSRLDIRNGEARVSQEKSKARNKDTQESTHGRPLEDDPEEIYIKHRAIIKALAANVEPNPATYEEVYQEVDDRGQNLVHGIIQKFKQTKATPTALDVTERLILDKPDLFTQADEEGKVPLQACASSNVDILFRVIDLVIPDHIRDGLSIECDDNRQGCPLRHVHKGCLKRHRREHRTSDEEGTHEDIERDELFDAHVVAVTDADGNETKVEAFCLHGSIHVDRLVEKDESLRQTLSRGLSCGIKRHEDTVVQSLLTGTNFDSRRKDFPVIPLEGFKRLLQLCPDSVLGSSSQIGYSPLQMAIRLYDDRSVGYDHLFSIIQLLVDRHPSSIYFKAGYDAEDDQGKTAYRLLTEPKDFVSVSGTESEFRKCAEELFKRTCIGSTHKTHDEKREFLYCDAKSG